MSDLSKAGDDLLFLEESKSNPDKGMGNFMSPEQSVVDRLRDSADKSQEVSDTTEFVSPYTIINECGYHIQINKDFYDSDSKYDSLSKSYVIH